MTLSPEDVLKILLAVTAGGLIGLEREFRDKAAGFRTLIFISAGACLFTVFSSKLAVSSDPTRIAANIVTGVGFLGAGVILRDGGKVIGLTTAAAIWLTAAVGMGIGGGQYLTAGVMVLVAMIVLWLLPTIEHWINNVRAERTYEVVCLIGSDKFEALEQTFRECGLRIQSHRQVKSSAEMTCSWHASGSPRRHERLMRKLFEDPEIKEFRF
jgi:putative Mg2+ transporter-C (MgtC) family protein